MNFAKLVNGELVYAPIEVIVDGSVKINPSAESYAAAGYLPFIDQPPADPAPAGHHYEPSGYAQSATEIRREYTAVPDAPTYRRWTPRAIKVACGDKWPTVKAALVAADLFDEFVMSQIIDESCPSFAQGYTLACQTFGQEAVDTILNQAEVS